MTVEDHREDADTETAARHGEAVALALLADEPGDADGRTGWCGGLQAAADDSGDDPGILRIADDVHAAAPGLRDADDALALVVSMGIGARTTVARAFLSGMADALDPDPELDGVH